jgi:hypothetical protein
MIFAPQLKLASHPQFPKFLTGETVPIINIEISPSSVCDAKCSACFYKEDKNVKEKFIHWGPLFAFLLDADTHGLEAITWSGGGEPTLHPDFSDLVFRVASQTKLNQGLFTNALLKPKYRASFLKWIRVSKTNESWPDGHIFLLRQQNANVGLCVNYRGKEDDWDIKEGLRLVHKMELRYLQVRPALNIMGKTIEINLPDIKDDKLIITPYKFHECSKKDRGYTLCQGFHFSTMIWENGMMSPCMYMRHHQEYNIGSIYENRFVDLCEKMPKSLPVLDDCQICCKNNEINKLINDCKKLEDVSFV